METKPTIKSLTDQLERVTSMEKSEREKRYALETKTENLSSQVAQLEERARVLQTESEFWRAQLYRSQGHLTGMRETLLAAGLVKNPDMNFVDYDRQDPPKPKKLWPDFR